MISGSLISIETAPRAQAPVARIGLVADFAEEGWLSMDLVAGMLRDRLSALENLSVSLLRPEMKRWITRGSVSDARGLAWNAERILNRHIRYPGWLRPKVKNFDLFHIVDHSYAHLALGLPAQRTIVTCHDTDAFRCLIEPGAEPRPWWFRALARRILNGLRSAAKVICVSRTVQDQLVAAGLVSKDKTCVVYNGVHPVFQSDRIADADAEAAALLDRDLFRNRGSQIDILHVGSTIPRKRIDVLLQVTALLRARGMNVRLVRAGGPFTRDQQGTIADLGLGKHIRVLPHLSTEVLAAVYRRAALVLLPSEAEGFGLPLVEALASGSPVLASDIPVLREVGGPATAYAPVGDIEEWAATATALLAERASAPETWAQRRRAARKRARLFSWDANASDVARIYSGILNGGPRRQRCNYV